MEGETASGGALAPSCGRKPVCSNLEPPTFLDKSVGTLKICLPLFPFSTLRKKLTVFDIGRIYLENI